jgi:hypothetical protein
VQEGAFEYHIAIGAPTGTTKITFYVHEIKKDQTITAEVTTKLIKRPNVPGWENCVVSQDNTENVIVGQQYQMESLQVSKKI